MGADLESLHNILKDGTRREILQLLHEHKALSYVRIQELASIQHTGRLNYHLKVLGNLISKNEDGEYELTEKGVATVSLMMKFQDASPTLAGATRASYDDAARWAGYGMECFFGQFGLVLIYFLGYLAVIWMSPLPTLHLPIFQAWLASEFILGAIPSVLIGWLCRAELVLPLRRGELPLHARAWSLAFTALALFFGMGFGIIVMAFADEKVKALLAKMESDATSTARE